MVQGAVTDQGEAIVTISVVDAAGVPHSIEVGLDTGFTGMLVLPTALLQQWGKAAGNQAQVELADDQLHEVDVYWIDVDWHGQIVTVPAYSLGSSALLGMSMLHGSTIFIDLTEGGRIEIQPRLSDSQ